MRTSQEHCSSSKNDFFESSTAGHCHRQWPEAKNQEKIFSHFQLFSPKRRGERATMERTVRESRKIERKIENLLLEANERAREIINFPLASNHREKAAGNC